MSPETRPPMVAPLVFNSIRPLVRYVDEDQAVIDAHFHTVSPDTETAHARETTCHSDEVVVLVEIDADNGFHDEGETRLRLVDGHGSVRFEMARPQRWWPAPLGEQALYSLTLTLVSDDRETDRQQVAFGLTSVRRPDGEVEQLTFLVNGQECALRDVVMVDRVDESALLPATGNSLLLVRDHYGDDLLYEAADRAGILLVQCVPIHPDASPEVRIRRAVDRLAAHPSLAGWYVGHLGEIQPAIAEHLRTLDPTRLILDHLPGEPAA